MSKKPSILDAAISALGKSYGTGVLDPESLLVDIPVISTGFPSIDRALGVGGFPRGRIVEMFGAESSGKSTLALHTAIQAMIGRGRVLFVDYEHSYRPEYAKGIGVDVDLKRGGRKVFMVIQPQTLEQGMAIVEGLCATGEFSLVIVDSLAAMLPKKEMEGDYDKEDVAVKARAMARALRKLAPVIAENHVCLIFINQVIAKIKKGWTAVPGDSETTPGGRVLKFYAAMRVELRIWGYITEKRTQDGKARTFKLATKVQVQCVKNKVGAPFLEANIVMRYGGGIDMVIPLVEFAIQKKRITRSNGFWRLPDGVAFRSKVEVYDHVRKDPKMLGGSLKKAED